MPGGRRMAAVTIAAGVALALSWLAVPVAAHSGSATADVQALIDTAEAGDTIRLEPGRYTGAVTIDRPLTLLGTGGVSIDGLGAGSVVTIAAPDVELGHLRLVGSGRNPVGAPSGLLIDPGGARAYVHDVAITDSYLGVTIRRAPDVRLERVVITGAGIISGELHAVDAQGEGAGDGEGARLRGDGVWVNDASGTEIIDCTIETVRDGVYLSYGERSLISGTSIVGSRYAVHAMYASDARVVDSTLRGNLSGIVTMYGGPVLVENDVITESGSPSTGFGVLVKDAADVTVRRSTIADNRVGLHIDDAGRTNGASTTVEGSTIAMNQIGVLLSPSADPVFTGNAFVENSTQVVLGGTGRAQAVWGRDGVGNHWSDYAGFDGDGDGVGDLPYEHGGRTSQLIAAEPLLLALSSGPAFRLLTAVEERWVPGDPIVRDTAPLASAPGAARLDRPSPVVPMWLPGAVLLGGCALALARGRRRVTR